ncbi:AMP deaminase, partial [Coemansia aciculifera]
MSSNDDADDGLLLLDGDDEERSGGPHPYMTYNALASSSYAAGPTFVNAYFAKQPKKDPLKAALHTPDSEAVRQRQGPAAAAMLQCKQALSFAGTDCGTPMSLGPTVAPAEKELPGDDDLTSREIEDEIRKMMIQTHSAEGDDGGSSLESMSESPQELQRIGRALTRCMELRDKYMQTSLQRESDNPRNYKQWQIYPAPPPPGWHSSSKKSTPDVGEIFDFAQCAIPGDDEGYSFAMTEEGVYAVADPSGETFTSAPSIREFFMDLDFLIDTISD